MLWFVLTAIVILILIACLLYGFSGEEDSGIAFGAGAVVLVIWLLISALFSFHSVSYNHVLIVQSFGKIVGRTGDGLVMTAPWQSTDEESTRTQRRDYPNVQAPSVENQDITIHAVISYEVTPDKVMNLYRQYGANWYDTLVDPHVETTIKAVTAQYPAIDLQPKRFVVEQQIKQALEARLSTKKNGSDVNITDVNLSEINLPGPLVASIVEKNVAFQNALAEKNKVQVARYRGEQKLALAEQQAKANKLLSNSISPQLIQYESLQKLQPNVSVCVIPSGVTALYGNPCSVVGK